MKKMSLLATSVVVALSGCGSDNGSDSDPSVSNYITGFDGYLHNAVVFIDKDADGVWDANSDTFLGLTDIQGRVDIGDTTVDGTLALQTLIPGGDAQQDLIDLDPELYSGVYTVDQDLPGQPLSTELVFRAPQSSDVISPITDLVAIEMHNDASLTEEEAISVVNKSLNDGVEDEDFDPYVDFVSGADEDPAMHKVAQILSETKADDPVAYQQDGKATAMADEAKQVVDDIVENNPEDLDDPSYVVIVDGDTNSGIETPSYKTIVDHAIYETVQDKFDDLELEHGQVGSSDYLLTADITSLFSDKDVDNIDLSLISIDQSQLADSNVQVVYNPSNGALNLGVSPSDSIAKAGDFAIVVTLADSDDTNETHAVFEFEIDEGEAEAPEYSEDTLQGLQDEVDLWQLVQGESLGEGYFIDFSELFSGDSELELSFSSNAESNGLIFDNMGTGLIGIQGTPLRSSEDDETEYTIKLMATDQNGLSTSAELELPEVAEPVSLPSEITIDQDKLTALQAEITKTLEALELTVGMDSFQQTFDVTEVFATTGLENVEYYAGSANDDEGETSIAGISVTMVDDSAILAIYGSPTVTAEDGEFVLMAGSNVDSDNEIISEAVTIKLPAVSEGETSEPELPSADLIIGKDLYFIETPEANGDIVDNRCESFKLEDGQVYFGDENYQGDLTESCAPVSSQASATYTVADDVITIVEDDYDPMTMELLNVTGKDGVQRFIIRTTELRSNEDNYVASMEVMESVSEAESRVDMKSNTDSLSRMQQTSLYIDGEYVDVYVTTQMENSDDGGNDEAADADLFFDRVDGGNLTCDQVAPLFYAKTFSGSQNATCFDNEENDGSYHYVGYDFDFAYQHELDKKYRISFASNDDEHVADLNFNITYDGDSFEND
ncbi:acid phosphatase [Vibrio hippocampi]|uniref:Dystroglycan-type cadherin-like domain-containing protein n=1 Tax=Vibrio hippocampi TaxID=654686 RepID=A0ABM8ZLT1_9VIBR|nr:acid phosphatase [Vibrio hippocampi]CAH0529303.1 hypothetical protein VHP8226_03152 [Vibrio hippocampi]